MCKLIIFTVAPLANKPRAQRLLFNRLLVKLAETEKDGLGIAYLSADGKLHRRRWGKSMEFKGILTDDLRAKFCEVNSDPVDESPATGFVIMHGRTATSKVCLGNSHPHVAVDSAGTTFALIHNGVVDADDKDKAVLGPFVSTCDSELILHAFIDGGMENVSRVIRGRYAFGMIVSNADGTSYLHVVKDNKTSLYAGENSDGKYVFSTTSDLLKEAGVGLYASMSQLTHLSFDGNGELLDIQDIPEPQYAWKAQTNHQHQGQYGSEQRGSPVSSPTQAVLALPEATGANAGLPVNPITVLEESTPLHEIDRKIAKAEARGKHVRALRLKSIRAQMMRKEISSENAGVISEAEEPDGPDEGINAVPLSDDQAEALMEAERQASGVGI